MYIFHFIYFVIVVITCVTSYLNSDPSIGLICSGFFAPLIAWFSGSGLRGSLYGTSGQKIFGIILGIIGFILSSIWIYFTGWWIAIYDLYIDGNTWVLIGFLIGIIFTSKKDAVFD